MPRVILPEQVILVSQSLDLGRKLIEKPPKFARNPRIHSLGFGKGRLLPSLYSLVAASMSRSSFPPGSASFFICRSQSSSSIGFSKAASSQRSSGLSCSIAALISSTRSCTQCTHEPNFRQQPLNPRYMSCYVIHKRSVAPTELYVSPGRGRSLYVLNSQLFGTFPITDHRSLFTNLSAVVSDGRDGGGSLTFPGPPKPLDSP
jgi:hypothetical protein